MRSELGSFSYADLCLWLCMFWVMLLCVAAAASAEISNVPTQHLQEFSVLNFMAHSRYIHPSPVDFNET